MWNTFLYLNFYLDGPPGSGKQMALAQVLHYGLIQKMMLIHIPFGNLLVESVLFFYSNVIFC